jgi:hypothetical protein
VEEDRGIVGRRSSEQSQRGVSRRPVSLHATTTGLVGRQPAAAVAKSSAVRSAMGTAASGVNSSDPRASSRPCLDRLIREGLILQSVRFCTVVFRL